MSPGNGRPRGAIWPVLSPAGVTISGGSTPDGQWAAMDEIYRLGCEHRQAHAERGDLFSKLTDSLGRYDGPLYRSPAGYAVFSHDEHEAAARFPARAGVRG